MFCKPPHPVYIVLFRGDDTDFVGNQEIIVKITTERNISGCKAYFKYMGNIQTFDAIPEDKELHLVFSREQTKDMPLGTWDAELYLIDENGKRMTVNNRIHMLVTNSVGEAYFPDDPQAVSVVISANKYIEDAEVSANGKTLTLTKKDGTEVSFSGGGGGGGTNDYNDLENKPSINGTTLTGNVNLATPEQLSLKADKANVYTKEDVDSRYSALSDQIIDISNSTNILSTTIDQHTRDTTNPHKVTAAQVGALPLTGGTLTGNLAIGTKAKIELNAPSDDNGAGVNIGAGSSGGGWLSVAGGPYSGGYVNIGGSTTNGLGGKLTVKGGVDGGGVIEVVGDDASIKKNGKEVATEEQVNVKADKATTLSGYGITDAATKTELNAKADKSALAAKADKSTTLAGYGITDAATKTELAAKADKTSLAPEYSPSSAYSVGALVYHDGNIYQCMTTIAEGGEAWNAAHWELRKLDDFFTESNSLLNGRLAYSHNATGLKDRAFNTLSFDGTEFNLSTALAAVTPTASGQPRDLLIVATATAATTISFTAGTIKGDKPTIDGSGTWLITLTEYASGVWYCRQIKMEDAA